MPFQFPSVKAVFRTLAAIQVLLTVPPVILTFWLYHLAQRAAQLIGRWPVPMVNDPKWIGQNDALYQQRYEIADRLDDVAFCSFFIWIVVMAVGFRGYSPRTRLLQAGLFVLAWGLLWFNPWSLLYW